MDYSILKALYGYDSLVNGFLSHVFNIVGQL